MSSRNSGLLAAGVLFIILISVSAALIYTCLPEALESVRAVEHYTLWLERDKTPALRSVKRVLYRGDIAVRSAAILPGTADNLHLAAEAAIAEPSKAERGAGLVSHVPEGTRLLGIAEKDGYIFIDLSDEMLNADERAFDEIRESIALSHDFRDIFFMIEGDLIS